MKKEYGPMDTEKAEHLIDKSVLCAVDKEGLGTYAVLIEIYHGTEKPYCCLLEHSKQVVNYKWIAG